LGGEYNLTGTHVWNDSTDAGAQDINVYVSNNPLSWGSATALTGIPRATDPTTGVTRSLSGTGQYVLFRVSGYTGGYGADQIGLEEVRFIGSPAQPEGEIPEPATLVLLGLAVTGLGGYVRRRFDGAHRQRRTA